MDRNYCPDEEKKEIDGLKSQGVNVIDFEMAERESQKGLFYDDYTMDKQVFEMIEGKWFIITMR